MMIRQRCINCYEGRSGERTPEKECDIWYHHSGQRMRGYHQIIERIESNQKIVLMEL